MIWVEFLEVVVRKLSEKSTEPCKNWNMATPEIKTNRNNTPEILQAFWFEYIVDSFDWLYMWRLTVHNVTKVCDYYFSNCTQCYYLQCFNTSANSV